MFCAKPVTLLTDNHSPKLSYFQWHPFTVSTCIDDNLTLHIKTDGNWVSKLRDLAKEGEKTKIKIGIDGPYGAPASRFYDFNQSIIMGSGIGVTPFSGILTDMKRREDQQRARMAPRHSNSSGATQTQNNIASSERRGSVGSTDSEILEARSVHFHWIVSTEFPSPWERFT